MKKTYFSPEEISEIKEINQVAQTLLQNKVVISTVNMSGDRINKLFKRSLLDLNPWFQRGDVWSDEQRAKLVDSFLTKTPIPAVYLELYKKQGGYDYFRVIDGKQRLTSLTDFIQNKFAITYEGQPEDCEWKGRKWDREPFLQDTFEAREIPVIILDTNNCTESERDAIEEYVFQRWNDQSSLTYAELRHSIKGVLNDLIETKLLPIFMEKYPILAKDNKRMVVNEIIERIVYRSYIADDITHSHPKHRDLVKFHKSNLNQERLDKVVKEIEWSLMMISKNIKISEAKKTISAVHKVDLVMLGVDFLRKFGKSRSESQFPNFLNHFVETVVRYKKLLKGAYTQDEHHFMNKVNELFEKYRGGVNGSNKFRHDFWVNEFIVMSHLETLDHKRFFSEEEKELKWLEQNGKCAHCQEDVKLKGSQADHIEEWIMGNKSVEENLQILCTDCHTKKTSEFNRRK
jgi:hypothetical protein